MYNCVCQRWTTLFSIIIMWMLPPCKFSFVMKAHLHNSYRAIRDGRPVYWANENTSRNERANFINNSVNYFHHIDHWTCNKMKHTTCLTPLRLGLTVYYQCLQILLLHNVNNMWFSYVKFNRNLSVCYVYYATHTVWIVLNSTL